MPGRREGEEMEVMLIYDSEEKIQQVVGDDEMVEISIYGDEDEILK